MTSLPAVPCSVLMPSLPTMSAMGISAQSVNQEVQRDALDNAAGAIGFNRIGTATRPDSRERFANVGCHHVLAEMTADRVIRHLARLGVLQTDMGQIVTTGAT